MTNVSFKNESDASDYPLGYNKTITNIFSQRTVETHASHLIPYLKPGLSLLDVGCGPGSITTGFAERLEKGKVIGIDIEPSQIEKAKKLAKKHQIGNVTFQVGDVFNLPFDDESFDIVHTNALLCQLDNPAKALSELKRVTKKDGIIACREPNFDCYLFYPDDSSFKEALNLAIKATAVLGCDFNLGKILKYLFDKAMLQMISVGSNFDNYGTKESVEHVCVSFIEDWKTSPWSKEVRKRGWASDDQINEYLTMYQHFADQPGAYLAVPWTYAIGRNIEN